MLCAERGTELPFHFMLSEVGGRQGGWVDPLRKLVVPTVAGGRGWWFQYPKEKNRRLVTMVMVCILFRAAYLKRNNPSWVTAAKSLQGGRSSCDSRDQPEHRQWEGPERKWTVWIWRGKIFPRDHHFAPKCGICQRLVKKQKACPAVNVPLTCECTSYWRRTSTSRYLEM